ncbi:MAG: hypothetical protein JXD18_00785 [Anaerolineae bacterium]|nr:hypothetical protein [Anaerolineae bacterium]
MAAQPERGAPPSEDVEAGRDLRNVLFVGSLTTLVFGAMIVASESGTGALQIPTLENSIAALLAALVMGAGLLALKLRLSVRGIAWGCLLAYTLIVSYAIHYTGGPQTPVPSLYLVIVVAASFLLGRRDATLIAVLGAACYGLVLLLEYTGALSMVMIWRYDFFPHERGELLLINWIAVAFPTILTAQLTGVLSERLQRTNVHLRESERLRERLTRMVVHDLRSPLTALIGGLEILHVMLAKEMSADQLRVLEGARRSGRSLTGLVEEMLEVGRMEAGEMELKHEAVDFDRLLVESFKMVELSAVEEGLKIEAELNEPIGTVFCNRRLIRRVLANLLNNAIKYTSTGGTVTLSARKLGKDAVLVKVADTGVGIPPQYHQRVFETLGQADQGRRGTGLGLPFCKMTVEAHGGEIWIESQDEEGCAFYFTLPVSAF